MILVVNLPNNMKGLVILATQVATMLEMVSSHTINFPLGKMKI